MPLIVIPTPVGNLGDMTVRGLEELRIADVIACEDTRHTGVLLKKYDISARLISCHEHNEKGRAEEICRLLADGKRVALVSDAGTPGVSDPGYLVIKKAIEDDYDVDVLPGATAFVPAVLMSGLPPQPCLFYGFLPDKKGERDQVLSDMKDVPWTVIFYVSPHKIARHLSSIANQWGDRRAAMVREISKIHQETTRGTLSRIMEAVENGVKGEIVLVVEGASTSTEISNWEERGEALIAMGLSEREVVSALFETMGVPKNSSKKWILERKKSK